MLLRYAQNNICEKRNTLYEKDEKEYTLYMYILVDWVSSEWMDKKED